MAARNRRAGAQEPPPPDAWRSRIVRVGEAHPAELKRNAKNWREHPAAQRAAMTAALDALGWIQDVVVNLTTGNLLDGHLRVDLALERGEAVVPVKWVELTADEEERALAVMDPIGAMATANRGKLQELVDAQRSKAGALAGLLEGIGKRHGLASRAKAPTTSRGLQDKQPSLTLRFDNEDQRDVLYALLRWLKDNGEGETTAQRLVAFIRAAAPAGLDLPE